jgi:hypothetical protein
MTNPISQQKRICYTAIRSKEFLMTIAELEQAVTQLSEQELARFRAWFDEYYAQLWDKQIEEDAKSGRLDKIIAEVNEEYNAGLSKPL